MSASTWAFWLTLPVSNKSRPCAPWLAARMSLTAPDPIEYLDRAATSRPGRDYKGRLLTGLRLRPGQVVLDVGCGPGTDLAALAAAVGAVGAASGDGRVIGVDTD